MKLQHFTNRINVEVILKEKTLRACACRSLGESGTLAISLTSDESPEGHGLTDGRNVTEAQLRLLKYATETDGKYFCVDNTEFCISMDIEQSKVKKATSVLDQKAIQVLAITAHLPCSRYPTDQEIDWVKDGFKSKSLIDKSGTWWYHFGDIKLSEVDFSILWKSPSGDYQPLGVDAHGEIDLSSIPVKQVFEYF